jgi:hypothetical protein
MCKGGTDMKRRTKAEWFKSKVAFTLMIVATACADSGLVFPVIALMSAIWLLIISKRLERMGELDD